MPLEQPALLAVAKCTAPVASVPVSDICTETCPAVASPLATVACGALLLGVHRAGVNMFPTSPMTPLSASALSASAILSVRPLAGIDASARR